MIHKQIYIGTEILDVPRKYVWVSGFEHDMIEAERIGKLRRHIGPLAELFRFEPEGIDTVMTATILGTARGSEISFTMRLREVAPPQSGLPRREYPPPTALTLGLDKLWAAVDRELAARTRKP